MGIDSVDFNGCTRVSFPHAPRRKNLKANRHCLACPSKPPGHNEVIRPELYSHPFLDKISVTAGIPLIERKSRVPQLQGVQGRSCSHLPRALGNAEDGAASAFPKGKQNEKRFLKIQFAYRKHTKY
jgi:hypothetical protein